MFALECSRVRLEPSQAIHCSECSYTSKPKVSQSRDVGSLSSEDMQIIERPARGSRLEPRVCSVCLAS